jgi:hypothetical protein
MVAIEVSARQEYDDMYFRGKDREKNKSYRCGRQPMLLLKQKSKRPDEVFVPQDRG